MPDRVLYLADVGLRSALGTLVHDARTLIGWTQRELADRAGTSHTAIWRIETAQPGPLDVAVAERVLGALGMRCSLGIDDRHLADRRRQRDGVHGVLNGFLARRLVRLGGWMPPATEVQIGTDVPWGWIDLLAYRPSDRSLLVDETKTDIPDMGGLQRSVAFYEREAPRVAATLGWRPVRTLVLVLGLDSRAFGRRLADNRDLVATAFPGDVERMAAWLADPAAPRPLGWTLAVADPAVRGDAWLRPTTLGPRRRPPAYEGYADAARRLLRT
ncbi:MAG TPA: helix-turn-helix domain-containing protein [Candidatus Limnocylindrales bacterium]|nr:helix-turn-helix domain-containing protein [Candidatus Limnocylindrales bacterium]